MKIPYSRSDMLWIGISAVLTLLGMIGRPRSPELVWATWFFAACLAILLLAPVLRSRTRLPKERVEFDAFAIRRYLPSGNVESITWDELDEIGIVTTDEGPYVDDVFWLFLNHDRSKGCAVSNAAVGFPALLEEIQRLPNFDSPTVIKAMGSASNNRFRVWKRAPAQPAAPADGSVRQPAPSDADG